MSFSDLQFDRFLLFGDSITELAYNQFPLAAQEPSFVFAPAVHNAYGRKLDVLQRGFSGYNSDWALKLLPKIIELEHRPTQGSSIKLATLFFGTNDAALGGPQKVELQKYLSNVSAMLDIFEQNDIKVVVIGPAKHDQANWHPRTPQDVAVGIIRTNESNLRYSEATKKLTQERGIAFVDLYSKFDNYPGDWASLLVDGIHFTGDGYRIMFDAVMEKIREHYPQFAPENLKYKLPYWRDFDKAIFEEKLEESIN